MAEARGNEVVEVLEKARARIEKPQAWTRGWYARTNSGESVYGHDPKACRFCWAGAIQAEIGSHGPLEPYLVLLRRATGEAPFTFNDTHSHREVLDAFDRAIELVRAKENP